MARRALSGLQRQGFVAAELSGFKPAKLLHTGSHAHGIQEAKDEELEHC